jgi:hypothetical protein
MYNEGTKGLATLFASAIQSPTDAITLHSIQAFDPTKYHPFVFELATRKRAELIEQLTEVHDNC